MVEAHATESLDIAVDRRGRHRPGGGRRGAQGPVAVTAGADPRSTTTEYDLGARRWHAHRRDAPRLGAGGDPRPRRHPARRGRRPRRAERRPRARPAAPAALRPRPLRQPAAGPALPGRRQPAGVERSRPATSTSSSSARAPRARTPATAAPCGSAPRPRSRPRSASTPAYGVERVVRDAFARAQARPRRHAHAGAQDQRAHLRRRPVARAPSTRSAAEFPDVTHRLPARRRGHDVPGHPAAAVRRHRHRQPLRRHPHRHRGRGRRRHRARRQRQHQPRRGTVPSDVRAGARLGARHRGPGQGRPDRDRSSRSRMLLEHLGRRTRRPRVEAAVAADLAARGGRRPERPPRSATPSPHASGRTGCRPGRRRRALPGRRPRAAGRARRPIRAWSGGPMCCETAL